MTANTRAAFHEHSERFTNNAPHVVDVLVIGAGISGIGAAIRLREEGIDNFIVLEKAESLGGTWRDNTYPGCACDVPSALYSYSFAQKPDWTRVFAGQKEILAYVKATAERFQVECYIRFNQSVEEATWQAQHRRWHVRTTTTLYHARFVIACSGYLHEPILPKLLGLETFSGKIFHSARWDHSHDLPLNQAVCASYGVPAWCPPVRWQGRTFIDGGVASPTSADKLIGSGVSEAIVLAPMASSELDKPRSPLEKIERQVRRYMTKIVHREVAALEVAGINVLRFEPGPEDLKAFGFNMMDPARRLRVLETALNTAPLAVRRAM